MNNNVGKGAIVLIVSGIICKILGALFRLPLTNIISIQGIGVFQMIMSIYSLLLVFVSSGVSTALSKLISSARAGIEKRKIGSFIKTATLFSLTTSIILGLIFSGFSKQIALLQGIEGQGESYFLFVLILPLGAIIALLRGIIQGYENMTPTAVSQVVEQTIKFSLGLLFAFLFQKYSGRGVFGAFIGILSSEIFAFVYLLISCRKNVSIQKFKKISVKKEFFSASLPLTFSSSIIPLTGAIEVFLIVSLLGIAGYSSETATSLYGLQSGVVGAILHFPLIISLSVGTAILPKISFLSAQKDDEKQKEIIAKAFFLMWFSLLPLTIGITAVSKEVLSIIYPSLSGGNLVIAGNLMSIGAVATILSATMQFFVAILGARGLFKQYLIYSIIGGICKLLSLCFFAIIPSIGIYAIPISNTILAGIVCSFSILKLRKNVEIDFFEILLPIFASVLMFLIVKIILFYITGIVGLIFSILFGAIVYFLSSFPLTNQVFREFLIKIKKIKIK